MVNAAIQIGLQVSAHGAMHRTGQEPENHPVGMMNSPPRQFETAAKSDFLEGIFDGLDHLGHRKNLTDRRVFQKEHWAPVEEILAIDKI